MIVFVLIVSFSFYIHFSLRRIFLSVKILLAEKWKGESNANKLCWPGRYCWIRHPSGTRGGDSIMKGAGMLVGNFELNPKGDQSGRGPTFFEP